MFDLKKFLGFDDDGSTDITEQLSNSRKAITGVACRMLSDMTEEDFAAFASEVDEKEDKEKYLAFLKLCSNDMNKVASYVVDLDIIDKHFDEQEQKDLPLDDSMKHFLDEVFSGMDEESIAEFAECYNDRKNK